MKRRIFYLAFTSLVIASLQFSLSGCSNPSKKTGEPATEKHDLTGDELSFFTVYANEAENNGFLLSTYTSPQDIDLDQLFYNGAGMMTKGLTQEETAAYLAATDSSELITDMVRLTTEQIDNFLQHKMGISLSETNGLDWTYLEDFDSYYIEHGDTNFRNYTCTSGQEENGTYHLEFQSEDGSLTSSLTLKKNGDEYQFLSNVLA